jgi:hypothetical protein
VGDPVSDDGWPQRADCDRPGCGHSSDVHVFLPKGNEGLSVTMATGAFPCYADECECSSMVRSVENYLWLTEGHRSD